MRFFTRNCYASKGVTCTMQGRFLLRETGQAHRRDALETKLRNKGGNRSREKHEQDRISETASIKRDKPGLSSIRPKLQLKRQTNKARRLIRRKHRRRQPNMAKIPAPKLRAAIREIAAAREVNQISTRNVLLALIERKGEPWAALWGRDIASGNVRGPAAKLARLLKPFGIAAHTIREPDGSTPKGYKLQHFEDAFSRYLPPKPHLRTPQRRRRMNKGSASDSKNATNQAYQARRL